MKNCEFDALLRQGLLRAAEEEADELRHEEAFDFSPEYRKFRSELLEDPFRCARRRKRPLWKKALQAAACFLLASAVGLGVTAAVSPSVRAGLMSWLRKTDDWGVSYDFLAKPMDQVPPRYEIGALPEGYAEAESYVDPKIITKFYRNESGLEIYFEYMYMEQGISLGILTEGAEFSDIEVNGCEGHFYYYPDGSSSNTIVWMDEEAGLLFTLDMRADKDQLLRLAESVYLAE